MYMHMSHLLGTHMSQDLGSAHVHTYTHMYTLVHTCVPMLQDFLDDTSLSQDSTYHGDPGGVSQPRPPILDYTNPILKMY